MNVFKVKFYEDYTINKAGTTYVVCAKTKSEAVDVANKFHRSTFNRIEAEYITEEPIFNLPKL